MEPRIAVEAAVDIADIQVAVVAAQTAAAAVETAAAGEMGNSCIAVELERMD